MHKVLLLRPKSANVSVAVAASVDHTSPHIGVAGVTEAIHSVHTKDHVGDATTSY